METKNCQNCKKDFTIDADDFSFYEKMQVPPPTFCPECRMIRRFNYRNESMLFRRKDGHDGKEIFSGFSPKSPVVTYENKYWYSTEWDPLATGVEYDFSRPFFEQYRELMARAPLPSRSILNLLNSDYCNEASETKNSYLCFNVDYTENSGYCRKVAHLKDCFDVFESTEDELCYESLMVDKSYQTLFSIDCENCVNVWFSKGLRGCTNCFGSVNLKNKSYYFFNEPLTKEEYAKRIEAFNSGSHQTVAEMFKRAKDFWLQFPVKYSHTLRTIYSTGERIYDSKNVKDSYSVKEGENLRYCQDIQPKASNSYDYSVWGAGSENMYECETCGVGCYNVRFCFNCWDEARDLEYCVYCIGSKNCFGSVGLYKKEYCIFNTQYTKEEYFALREKIIEHMNSMPYVDSEGNIYRYGEFFPADLSPVAYNESLAQDFFPLSKEEAEKRGLHWHEIERKEYQTTMKAAALPDSIDEVTEEITKELIECATCLRAYRIIPLELQFYKKMKLPLPRFCHECRFIARFKFMNPPKLWHRNCMCINDEHGHSSMCPNEFESSYFPEGKDVVYCEECYQKEVI
jgi:hypothetical protein